MSMAMDEEIKRWTARRGVGSDQRQAFPTQPVFLRQVERAPPQIRARLRLAERDEVRVHVQVGEQRRAARHAHGQLEDQVGECRAPGPVRAVLPIPPMCPGPVLDDVDPAGREVGEQDVEALPRQPVVVRGVVDDEVDAVGEFPLDDARDRPGVVLADAVVQRDAVGEAQAAGELRHGGVWRADVDARDARVRPSVGEQQGAAALEDAELEHADRRAVGEQGVVALEEAPSLEHPHAGEVGVQRGEVRRADLEPDAVDEGVVLVGPDLTHRGASQANVAVGQHRLINL
jgi:hypothetical protein